MELWFFNVVYSFWMQMVGESIQNDAELGRSNSQVSIENESQNQLPSYDDVVKEEKK